LDALAKDREQRPATAEVFRARLDEIARSLKAPSGAETATTSGRARATSRVGGERASRGDAETTRTLRHDAVLPGGASHVDRRSAAAAGAGKKGSSRRVTG